MNLIGQRQLPTASGITHTWRGSMHILDQNRPRAWSASLTESGLRVLFVVVVVAGGMLFWLAPHPPMVDLPQHAAQIATLHDLLLHQSPWTDLLQLNLFTPYLLAYGLAVALSFAMSVTAAIKVLLTLSFYAFVASYVALRKQFGADARLDWLCLPGFFGFAYEFGFFSYLVAAPIGMVFLLTARDYAEAPSLRRGLRLLVADIAVFFSHGLVFVFVSAIGGAFLLTRHAGDWRRIVRSSWPFLLLAALCGAYTLAHRDVDLIPMYPFKVQWQMSPLLRIVTAMVYPWGIAPRPWMAPATMLMFAAPFCMGARWSPNRTNWAPLAIVGLVWFFVPSFAMNTGGLFPRFALFIFPFYALVFRSTETNTQSQRGGHRLLRATQMLLAAVCVAFLGAQGVRAIRFANESADFDAVAASVEPAQRALMIVFDADSPAAQNPVVYGGYALWYQADHRGLVDFNFAWFPPQIVRYRPSRLPAVGPSFEPISETFNWYRHHGWAYRYYFVRHTGTVPERFFANPDCRVVLLKTVGHGRSTSVRHAPAGDGFVGARMDRADAHPKTGHVRRLTGQVRTA
jgi:hypothetical protein